MFKIKDFDTRKLSERRIEIDQGKDYVKEVFIDLNDRNHRRAQSNIMEVCEQFLLKS